LQPRIQGTALHMPSIFIFLAVIAGGEIAGLLGVIFAVPALAALKVLFDFFWVRLQTEN
jgi:predicted PurR-regulated permease PerM